MTSRLAASRFMATTSLTKCKSCTTRISNYAINNNRFTPPSSFVSTNCNKRFLSSPPSSSSPSAKPESSKKDPPTFQNLALASVLFGFVTYVFLYSMNSVGRADGEEDPLAQLKAEAHEAQESAKENRKLTPEEIQSLESGMTGGVGLDVEVAVAAPADIAALEEEANMKIFRAKQQAENGDKKTKKPWWRFGF